MTATTFTNPLTDVTYRLVLSDDAWRITRHRVNTAGGIHLAHLRARQGTDRIAQTLIASLVSGQSGRSETDAEGHQAFASVVARDLDQTLNYLVDLAANAGNVLRTGRPGFRAGSPVLRQRRDAARQEAEDGARTLAAAWAASGLVGEGLPDWLSLHGLP